MNFKEYVINTHPDPDTLFGRNTEEVFDQICRLADGFALYNRGTDMEFLENYSLWLTKNGYIDRDWQDECSAIDEFMKQNK